MLTYQKELLRLTRSCLVHCLRVQTFEREVPYRGLWGVRPRLGELCSLKRTLEHMGESSMHMCAHWSAHSNAHWRAHWSAHWGAHVRTLERTFERRNPYRELWGVRPRLRIEDL